MVIFAIGGTVDYVLSMSMSMSMLSIVFASIASAVQLALSQIVAGSANRTDFKAVRVAPSESPQTPEQHIGAAMTPSPLSSSTQVVVVVVVVVVVAVSSHCSISTQSAC